MLIVTALQPRGLIAVRVAPVVGKDGDGATSMKPLVVGHASMGCIPQVPLPRSQRDSECTALRDKLGAFCRVAWGGRVAQGHFQAQVQVKVGSFEVQRAQDCLALIGVFGVDVDTDVGLQVRWHFGAAAHERTV